MVEALATGAVAFLISLILGRPLVSYLRKKKAGKAISDLGPRTHLIKAGTPTMGGLLIIGTVVPVSLAANLVGHYSILLPLGMLVATAFIGWVDDLGSLVGGGRKGLSWRTKLAALVVLGAIAGWVLWEFLEVSSINVPWLGKYDIGLLIIPVAIVAVVGTTSGVAITDGLDSLSGGTTAIAFTAYAVIAFIQDQPFLSEYCFTVAGATLGFLWYNSHPAQVFMGDTGALALGSTLAVVALMTGQWLLLPVVGVVFVANAMTDVLQITYYKATGGKRLFKMSPLHHHFELLGWSEPQVVTRFWLVGMAGAMVGIALALKV